MSDLVAIAEEMERILALDGLQCQVRHHMTQGETNVAAHDIRIADCATFADPDAVEGAQDRVWQPELLEGALREVLARELLKTVRGSRRWACQLGSLRCRKDVRRFVDHRTADDDDPLEMTGASSNDGGIESRRHNSLIFGQKIVGELMEIADAPDHRSRRHDLVA